MSTATLSAPVGKLGSGPAAKGAATGNQQADVMLVQRLLNKAACTPKLPENGKASEELNAAISDFQSAWLAEPDGRIDPGGATLRRLLYLTGGAWTMRLVKNKKIEKGGYCIGYEPAFNWPRKYRTYLTLHNSNLSPGNNLRDLGELPHCLDVTNRNNKDLLTYDDLPDFLAAIEALGDSAWGTTRYCAIYIARDNVIIGRSRGAAAIACPVRPLGAEPAVIMPEKETLPYTHTGPLITPTPINGKYWFRYGGEFATDNSTRGFNCCTYPAAVYGLTSGTGSGASIADAIAGGVSNDVDGGSYGEMMKFLTGQRTGTYLFWYDFGNAGHVVLVVDGEAHEWSESAGGYKKTTIPSSYDDKKDGCLWGSKKNGKYWVRSLD